MPCAVAVFLLAHYAIFSLLPGIAQNAKDWNEKLNKVYRDKNQWCVFL